MPWSCLIQASRPVGLQPAAAWGAFGGVPRMAAESPSCASRGSPSLFLMELPAPSWRQPVSWPCPSHAELSKGLVTDRPLPICRRHESLLACPKRSPQGSALSRARAILQRLAGHVSFFVSPNQQPVVTINFLSRKLGMC